jgi:hypothetical protein
VGIGKKRRRRAGVAPGAPARRTVPDVEEAEEGKTSVTVTRSASPGRARAGETRTVGVCDGPGSVGNAGVARKATAATARILK